LVWVFTQWFLVEVIASIHIEKTYIYEENRMKISEIHIYQKELPIVDGP